MSKFLVLSIILLSSSISWSQNDFVESPEEINGVLKTRVNSLYIEAAGKGILGSINYERVLPFSDKQAMSIGVSGGFLLDLAADLSYIVGKGNHFAQLGVAYSIPGNLLIPHVGYRYQANSGFLFKIGPMYFVSLQPESFGDFIWGGISFGYSFRKSGLKPVN